ncbi:MAG: tRNA uridine-5-carboxymethylaminomethyl(34) synthesis GTPase MnmE [Turneriella sp.]|nr:tRNA uridine-5-carboxymethylaminomethyl(34) synthesis GTPase MnmE [Turneriella sp.]
MPVSEITASPYDAICAPATAAGRSAIAIIRASGPASGGVSIFQKLGDAFKTKDSRLAADIPPRQAHYGVIAVGSETIDDIVFIKYTGPASFTGEDSFEIYCHGNPLVIRQILALLYQCGFRAAAAGEFTRRAYLNGKLSIDGAQAIAEIIEARNGESLKAARRLKAGTFRTGLLTLRSRLMNLLADLNAELDFIDEDISFATLETKLEILAETAAAVENLRADAERFDTFKDGVNIAIVGRPNAGKSSLMNRLLGEERSIVSDIAGTTRDYIEGELTIAGFNVRLFDTAGLAETTADPIEKIGIERTRELIGRAHICIYLFDGAVPASAQSPLPAADAAAALKVINKVDVLHPSHRVSAGEAALQISAKTGAGITELLTRIETIIAERAPSAALPLNLWQRELLAAIGASLNEAAGALRARELPEVVTHIVQGAVDRIAELTGEISSEDILGRIFSRFCIGK